MISANQLSVRFMQRINRRASGKPAANEDLETMESPTRLSAEETQTNAQQRRNLVQEHKRKFEQLSEDPKLSKLCSDAGLKHVEQGQYFYSLNIEEGQQKQHLGREYTMRRNDKGV